MLQDLSQQVALLSSSFEQEYQTAPKRSLKQVASSEAMADLVSGSLLGEQALRLCVLAFIVLRFRARLRFFPLWQQALALLVLLINDRVVVLMVRIGVSSLP